MARAKAADLLVLVGGRLGEIPSQGYSLLSSPSPLTKLVHIHPGAEEIGRVYRPHLAIHASPNRFVAALKRLSITPKPVWRESAEAAHADYLAWTGTATPQPGEVNLGEIMVWLRDHVPTDTILCNGAGNYASWIHRFYRFRQFMTHVAPTSASMGYGMPAAVGVALAKPGTRVIALIGDGSSMYSIQAIWSAVQLNLPITFVILNNSRYAALQDFAPVFGFAPTDPVQGTDLPGLDFVTLAAGMGCRGVAVKDASQLRGVLSDALQTAGPMLVEVVVA